jgi:hypothetical protein
VDSSTVTSAFDAILQGCQERTLKLDTVLLKFDFNQQLAIIPKADFMKLTDYLKV